MRSRLIASLAALAIGAGVIVPACDSGTVAATDDTILSRFDPPGLTATVAEGDTVDYTGFLYDVADARIGGVEIEWKVADPSILARIPALDRAPTNESNSRAAYRAARVGVTTVTGTTREVKTASGAPLVYQSTITVVGTPSRLEVAPIPTTMKPGDTVTVVGTVRDAQGRAITNRTLIWRSLDPTIVGMVESTSTTDAELDSESGAPVRWFAKKDGSARVEYGVVGPNVTLLWRDTAEVRVASAPPPPPPPALVFGSHHLPPGTVGRAYAGHLAAGGGTGTYAWALISGALPPGMGLAANGSVAGIPTTAGTFVFHARVTSGAQSASTGALSIVVAPPPRVPTSIEVAVTSSPATGSVTVGQARQYAATVRDQDGQQIAATIEWGSSNNEVASVGSSGLATCHSPGTVTVLARVAGTNVFRQLSLTCAAPPTGAPQVHAIFVEPQHESIAADGSFLFQAKVYGEGGADITSQVTVTWSSEKTVVATIEAATGIVRGVQPGGAIIVAHVGDQEGVGAITVGGLGSIRVEATLAGSTHPAVGAELRAYMGASLVGTGRTNAAGSGYIPGLPPGTYRVEIVHPQSRTTSVEGVAVTMGQTTSVPPTALPSP